MSIWQTIEQQAQIKQEVMGYRLIDKVLDAFIMILAGHSGSRLIQGRLVVVSDVQPAQVEVLTFQMLVDAWSEEDRPLITATANRILTELGRLGV